MANVNRTMDADTGAITRKGRTYPRLEAGRIAAMRRFNAGVSRMTEQPRTQPEMDRPIVTTFADYMAACLADGVSAAEAYRSYRHAYRCALTGRSWDYEWRVRTKGIKCEKRHYEDAAFATDRTAT